MKAILVVGDGMADRPVNELDWKTPLEAAPTPSFDRMARTGICGIMDIISPGMPPGSDTATLALLGYDPLKVYSGRGAFEALGSGEDVLTDDVAFRCNFATVDQELVVLDRRAGRIENEDASKLAEGLQEIKLKEPLYAGVLFRSTVQHRAILIIRRPGLSSAVSDSDPGKVGEKVLDVKPLDSSSEAKVTAEIVSKLSRNFHKVLKEHSVNRERRRRGLPPANMILFRGAGKLPNIKPLSKLYNITARCVGATPLVRGVCKAAGMKLEDIEGATGTPQTDYMAKAESAVRALRTADFVLMHIKAPDVASHDRNMKQKMDIIAKMDDMLGYLFGEIDLESTYLAVTADHTTSLVTGNHEGDPVPVAITGPYVRSDDVEKFDERSCAKGGINRIKGMDLMPTLMNLLGKTRKFGA